MVHLKKTDLKHFLRIWILIMMLTACSNNKNEKIFVPADSSKNSIINQQDLSTRFDLWLNEYGLTPQDFVDTFSTKAFELWAYSDDLEKKDSAYTWYPSLDSSFCLLTNFNFSKKKTLTNKERGINYRFLDMKSKVVYIGMMQIDKKKVPLGYYWYDNKNIYILNKDSENNLFELMKLRMKVDSFWIFKTNKR